jgi:hypothetical protein
MAFAFFQWGGGFFALGGGGGGGGAGSGSGFIAIDDPIIQGRSRLYEVSRSVRLRVALLLQYLLQLALVTSNAAPL